VAEARVEPKGWVKRWLFPGLRVAGSLPLMYVASVAAGLVLYLLYLIGSNAADEPSRLWLGLGALAGAAVCAAMLIGHRVVLCEHPRFIAWVGAPVGASVAGIAGAVAAALGVPAVFALPAAAALFYMAAATAASGLTSAGSRGDAASLVGSGAAHTRAGAHWYGWFWRVPLALVATALAAGAAALAFSLFAAAVVPAQPEFALGKSIWQQVSSRPALGRAGGVVALLFASGGLAALFGLCVHVAVRACGRWRGRLHAWWLGVAGVTVALGVIAWILDGSLPRW
jgi:hypothetical protein